MYVTLIDTESKTIILSEEYVDHIEYTDADRETGKRAKVKVTALEAAEARARGLALEAGTQNAGGAHLDVLISDGPYAFPEPVAAPTEEAQP
jgi:hypothetical protein